MRRLIIGCLCLLPLAILGSIACYYGVLDVTARLKEMWKLDRSEVTFWLIFLISIQLAIFGALILQHNIWR